MGMSQNGVYSSLSRTYPELSLLRRVEKSTLKIMEYSRCHFQTGATSPLHLATTRNYSTHKIDSSAVTWNKNSRRELDPIHCPLCNLSMIDPKDYSTSSAKQKDRKPALIFLDIDGVLIEETRSASLEQQIQLTKKLLFPQGIEKKWYSPLQQNIALARHFDQKAVGNLERILQKVEESGKRPLVILSSSWRHSALLKQQCDDIYSQYTFSQYLCGKTPIEFQAESFLSPECKLGFDFYEAAQEKYHLKLDNRAAAIEFWLRDHHFDPVTTNFIAIDDGHQEYLSKFGKKFIEAESLLTEKNVKDSISILCTPEC